MNAHTELLAPGRTSSQGHTLQPAFPQESRECQLQRQQTAARRSRRWCCLSSGRSHLRCDAMRCSRGAIQLRIQLTACQDAPGVPYSCAYSCAHVSNMHKRDPPPVQKPRERGQSVHLYSHTTFPCWSNFHLGLRAGNCSLF